MRMMKRFLQDESAATAVEYGLIAAGIALAMTAAVSTLGTSMSSVFTSLSTGIR